MSARESLGAGTVPDAPAAAPQPLPARRRSAYLLLAPGMVWMIAFLLVPLVMMLYVSFWRQSSFAVTPGFTLENWSNFFSQEAYRGALFTTVRVWLIVLVASILVGYPAAVFVGLFVRNKTLQTVLLIIAIIPFWTSFLIRIIAWRPMLGQNGAINIVLDRLGLISQPLDFLLYSQVGMIVGMVQLYTVFVMGPVTFMLARIDPALFEAARDLGAGWWRIFRDIVLPLSRPGVVVGAIFVSVLVLGEFATPLALSGRKVNMLGNIVVNQVGSLKWALASVAAVTLTVVIAIVIVGLLRITNLRKEL